MRLVMLGGLIALAVATGAFAHPPSEITLTYDKAEHLLTVTVVHESRHVTKHYIRKATVTLNGTQIIVQQFSKQFTASEQPAVYFIGEAAPGDVLAVTVVCNLLGQKTGKVTVSE